MSLIATFSSSKRNNENKNSPKSKITDYLEPSHHPLQTEELMSRRSKRKGNSGAKPLLLVSEEGKGTDRVSEQHQKIIQITLSDQEGETQGFPESIENGSLNKNINNNNYVINSNKKSKYQSNTTEKEIYVLPNQEENSKNEEKDEVAFLSSPRCKKRKLVNKAEKEKGMTEKEKEKEQQEKTFTQIITKRNLQNNVAALFQHSYVSSNQKKQRTNETPPQHPSPNPATSTSKPSVSSSLRSPNTPSFLSTPTPTGSQNAIQRPSPHAPHSHPSHTPTAAEPYATTLPKALFDLLKNDTQHPRHSLRGNGASMTAPTPIALPTASHTSPKPPLGSSTSSQSGLSSSGMHSVSTSSLATLSDHSMNLATRPRPLNTYSSSSRPRTSPLVPILTSLKTPHPPSLVTSRAAAPPLPPQLLPRLPATPQRVVVELSDTEDDPRARQAPPPELSPETTHAFPYDLAAASFWLGTKLKPAVKIQIPAGENALAIYFQREAPGTDSSLFEWHLPVVCRDPETGELGRPLSIKVLAKFKLIAIQCAEFTRIPYTELSVSNVSFDPNSYNPEMKYIRFIAQLLPYSIDEYCSSQITCGSMTDEEYVKDHKSITDAAVRESRSPQPSRRNPIRRRYGESSSQSPRSTSRSPTATLDSLSTPWHSSPSPGTAASQDILSPPSVSFTERLRPDPAGTDLGGPVEVSTSSRTVYASAFYRPRVATTASALQPPLIRPTTRSMTQTTSPAPAQPVPGIPLVDPAKVVLDIFREQHCTGTDPARPVLVYPESHPDLRPVGVCLQDLEGLYRGTYLNDILIEVYLKHLLVQTPKHLRDGFHLFSSFFYPMLKTKAGYNRVHTWTKDKNVFEKKLLILPMYEQFHWYVCLVLRPDLMFQEGRKLTDTEYKTILHHHKKKTTGTRRRGGHTHRHRDTSRTSSASKLPPSQKQPPQKQQQHMLQRQETVVLSDEEEEGKTDQEDTHERKRHRWTQEMGEAQADGTLRQTLLASETLSPDTQASVELASLKGREKWKHGTGEGEEDGTTVMAASSFTQPNTGSPGSLCSTPRDVDSSSLLTSPVLGSGSTAEDLGDELAPLPHQLPPPPLPFDHMQCELSVHTDAPSIVVLDSLHIPRKKPIEHIVKYLSQEALYKYQTKLDSRTWPKYSLSTLPAQPNTYDCGIYMLHFIEQILAQWDQFSRCLSNPDLPCDNALWHMENIGNKRLELMNLFIGLAKAYVQKSNPKEAEGKTSS